MKKYLKRKAYISMIVCEVESLYLHELRKICEALVELLKKWYNRIMKNLLMLTAEGSEKQYGRGNKATLTESCGEPSIKAKAKKRSRIFQMYFPKGGN